MHPQAARDSTVTIAGKNEMRLGTAILIYLLLQTGCTSTSKLDSSHAVGAGPSPPTGEQVERLQQLRARYQQARETFAKTQDYGNAYSESLESARMLISALLKHWMALPDDSAEVPVVCQEIRTVYKDLAGSRLTERYSNARSFLARAVWPLLADDKLTPQQAVFLAKLTKPHLGVRINDKKARRGQPTEPYGWDVQAAYALAQIRSGNNKQAHTEVTTLHDKVPINYKANPKGRLDYGHEAGSGRYRNYTDYLQLCEALHALQAAISNNPKDATKHIENARKLRAKLSPEAAPLVTEVARRVRVNED